MNFSLLFMLLSIVIPAFSFTYFESESINGVTNYCAERDSKSIEAIALEHKNRIASDFPDTEIGKEAFLNTQVRPILHNTEDLLNKVYLVDGKAVGYINYYLRHPWHRILLPFNVGPNAVINHLAVDSRYQNNGYGTALLNAALKDLSEKSVNKVSLTTTSWVSRLDKYYAKFNFFVVRESKSTGCQTLVCRLKPHPIIIGIFKTLGWLRQFKR